MLDVMTGYGRPKDNEEHVARLTAGVSAEESKALRTALFRDTARSLLIYAGMWLALGAVVSHGFTRWSALSPYPGLAVSLLVIALLEWLLEWHRLRPKAPVPLHLAQEMAPPGRVCPKCGRTAVKGADACGSCGAIFLGLNLATLLVALVGLVCLAACVLAFVFIRSF